MTRRMTGLLVLLMLVSGVATVGAGVTTEYALSTDTGIDVGPQTVSLQGTSYTFTQIGKTTATSEFDVTTSVPSGTEYSLLIIDSNEQIQDSKRMNGSGTATFDAESFDPGTYLLAIIGPDGETQAVMPLVIAGYSTDLSAPNTATPGENVTIGVSVIRTDPDAEAISSVSVVITYQGNEREVTAERVADGTYEATVTLPDAGDYDVYAGVRGQSEINGQKQLVGISEKLTISVEKDTGEGTDDDSTEGTEDGDNSDGETTEPVTATESPTETASGTDTNPGSSSTATMTETATGPITPADETTESDPASIPMKGVQNLLILLLLVSAAARFGRRG